MREIPNIKFAEIEGYSRLLARGFDTIKETFNVKTPDALIERLQKQRNEAADNIEGQDGLMVQFGEEDLKLSPYGTRSALYVLGNDDFTIFIRSPKMEWSVSVEYRSAGLWEHGFEKLRERALKCLFKEVKPAVHMGCIYGLDDPRSHQRVSIVHFAFDFHSPSFSREMKPSIMEQIFCPQKVKNRVRVNDNGMPFEAIGCGGKVETLTIGNKKSIEVQVYNKGKEITDTNGKTWMYELWSRSGWKLPDDKKARDVWRLELRFSSEFLKNRGILTIFDVYEELPALLTEGLFTRRLSQKNERDRNRARWPMHPLWVAAYKELGEGYPFMLPLGRQTTLSDLARQECFKKSIAGNLRSWLVLKNGRDLTDEEAREAIEQAYKHYRDDRDGKRKTERAYNRYFFAKEAA